MRSVVSPVVSVVIPTYRRDPLLYLSIRAHLAALEGVDAELVVVVNGRADGFALELASLLPDTVTLVQLETNVGFGAGCNVGAEQSSGHYVVFSNDDFVPNADWLSHLVRRADSMTERSIVGSTIVDHAGRVLDGAGIFTANGDVAPRDRFLPYTRVENGPACRVPYVTGCGLLIDRELFTELNGFDSLYDPAYFEDVDLCLRAALAGVAVVHEPRAWGVHREGLTQFSAERTDLFNRSQERFRSRWGARFQGLAPHGNSRSAFRVLAVEDRLPQSSVGGNSARMQIEFDRLLAESDWELDILPVQIDVSFSVERSLLAGAAVVQMQDASAVLAEGSYAAVLVSNSRNVQVATKLIEQNSPSTPLILALDCLLGQVFESMSACDFASREEVSEAMDHDAEVLRHVDAVVTVSEVESKIVRDLVPHTPTTICVPIRPQASVSYSRSTFDWRLVMLASWIDGVDSSNAHALRSFLTTVGPLLAGGLRLEISGALPPPELVAEFVDHSVATTWVGVQPLHRLFSAGAVSVCANTVIGGVSMKLLDSLASGVPVIVSPQCAATLQPDIASRLRICHTPADYARHISELSDADTWFASSEISFSLADEIRRSHTSLLVALCSMVDTLGVTSRPSDRLPRLPVAQTFDGATVRNHL